MATDPSPPFHSAAWLESPIRTSLGELQLAGALQDVRGLDPKTMRVLGNYTFVYMVNVDGYYDDANGRHRTLKSGDLVLIFPELAHAYGPKAGKPWDQIYFVFNGPVFNFLRQRGILDPARPVWHLEPVDYWRHRLEGIIAGEPWQTEAGAQRVMGRFIQLIHDMVAADIERTALASRDRWLEESQRLLAGPGETGWLSPAQVAHAVGLNYDNFRKQFALKLGTSPGQFQKHRKVERACATIYQGGQGFKEIADEMGYCDVFHFSKAFKQVTGMTPSAFRKKAHA